MGNIVDLSLHSKTCSKCNVVKTLDKFAKQYSKKSRFNKIGTKSHCKECVDKYRRIYYSQPENKHKRVEAAWKAHGFVFTVQEYNLLLEKQNGVCAICGVKKNRNNTALCVDHDHKTGKIRGLLCHFCNTSLGKFNDDINLLQKAIEYIKEYNE